MSRNTLARRGIAQKLDASLARATRIMKSDPTFPAPVHLVGNTFRWFEDEIDAWLAKKPRASTADVNSVTAAATKARLARHQERKSALSEA